MNAFARTLPLTTVTAGLLVGQQDGSFEKTLAVSGKVDLDIKTDSGGITVRQGPAGTVHIHAILKAEHGWFGFSDVEGRIHDLERHPPVEQNHDQVRVGFTKDRELLKGISMRLEIETPAGTQLRARADSGGIRVEGVQGPVDCKTDSGGIEIDDISASVHVAADSGGIRVRNVKGPLFAHVDSGGIEASGIAGSIEAQTDSGAVRLAQTSPAPIHAKAESGGVTVTLAHGAGYDISADTESGRIRIPEAAVRSASSSHHVEGKLGGGGPLVKIQVDSGSVTID